MNVFGNSLPLGSSESGAVNDNFSLVILIAPLS